MEKESSGETKNESENLITRYNSLIPYLYIPSFSEPIRKTPGRPRSEKSYIAQQPKPKPKDPKTAKFIVDLPPAHELKDENGESWTLRCVCDETTDRGLLVYCDSCGTWQHAICFNLNIHTTPEKYLCEICGNRPIRCKCEQNLNYRFSLIKCSICGYYTHKRCAGMLYGPMPSGTFVCSYCSPAKSKFAYPKVRIPQTLTTNDNPAFTFSQENIDNNLNPHILTGPFHDFLMIDVFDSTLTRKEFFEALFDRFRPFFFLCHPLFITTIHKKRRQNLVQSVLNASRYLAKKIYNTNEKLFVRLMDSLFNAAIYKEPTFVDDPEETELNFSENARFEYQNLIPQSYAKMPEPQQLKIDENGEVVCKNNLTQGQFLFTVDGLLGDLEEFDYDTKVDGSLYQLFGTRFVLDASRFRNSFLHNFKRSMYGNCILKLFTVGDKTYCGVFVWRAQLEPYDPVHALTIKAGEPLKLGIDFIPAVIEDYTKWLSWHCGDLEKEDLEPQRPTPEQRELATALRISSEKAAKEKKKKIKQIEVEEKRKYKIKKKKPEPIVQNQPNEPLSLFELFEADDPGVFIFHVGNDLEEIEEAARIRVIQQPMHRPRGRPRINPKIGRPASTPVKPVKRIHRTQSQEIDEYDAEEEEMNSDDEDDKMDKEDEYIEKNEDPSPVIKKKRGRKPKIKTSAISTPRESKKGFEEEEETSEKEEEKKDLKEKKVSDHDKKEEEEEEFEEQETNEKKEIQPKPEVKKVIKIEKLEDFLVQEDEKPKVEKEIKSNTNLTTNKEQGSKEKKEENIKPIKVKTEENKALQETEKIEKTIKAEEAVKEQEELKVAKEENEEKTSIEEKQKEEEISETIPTKREPVSIFDERYQKKVLRSARKIHYKPPSLEDPRSSMLQILGLMKK